MRAIAAASGEGLDVQTGSITPDEAPARFGWLASIVGLDAPDSEDHAEDFGLEFARARPHYRLAAECFG